MRGFNGSDQPDILSNSAILIQNGIIRKIGPADELAVAYPDAELAGGPEFVVTPGFVNAHHHIGLTPLQLGSEDHPLELWFASRLALRDVDLHLDTLYSAFEMIASGVTTVQHLHSRAPGGPEEVLAASERVISAYRAIGMRASYSMALRDQNRLVYEADEAFITRLPVSLRPAMAAYFQRFTVPLSEQVEIFRELIRRHEADRLVKIQVAPSNLHWLSDKALETAAELSERHDVPMHMHLLETPYQKAYAAKRTGGSAMRHLENVGLLGPRMTIGHGVWMTPEDIDLCARSGTRLCHNCSSNLRLKSGVAPLNGFLARHIPVAIGIDEAGINDDRDMLQEMRLVLRVHRTSGFDTPHPSPGTVMRMATEHGAGTTPFAGSIGRLAPGMAADLVLFDWKAVTFPFQSPAISLVDTLVQRAKSGAVHSVMIDGEWVYRDRRFCKVDQTAVMTDLAARLAHPLTLGEQERQVFARQVMPHVRAFYSGYLE